MNKGYPVNRRIFIALLAFLLAPACPGTSATTSAIRDSRIANTEPKPVTISVTPRFQLAQLGKAAYIHVRVITPRNAQNRRLGVQIDGDTFRSWEEDRVGLGARYAEEWTIGGLTPGAYEARAVLVQVGEDGKARQIVDRVLFEIQ